MKTEREGARPDSGTRHLLIKQILTQRQFATVDELARELNVSKVTIRNDLSYLEQRGSLSRTHGGATVAEIAPRFFLDTVAENAKEKNAIGIAAADMIPEFSTVIIDTGSTTFRIAQHLIGKHVTVVTNSMPVFEALKGDDCIEILFLGGSFRKSYMGFTGPITKLAISQIHADYYFMGAGGFTETDIFCSNLVEAEIKREMIKVSNKVCFVSDHFKKGKTSFGHICGWDEVDVFITDDIDDDFQAKLVNKGLEVVETK